MARPRRLYLRPAELTNFEADGDTDMNKHFWNGLCAGLIASVATATAVYAAPGEYWEITTKMEMPGMPMAMPAMTVKVCVPAGGERNPQYMQKKDDKCQMSDVKTSGNKVSWKVKCVDRGETMTGSGESTHDRDSWRGSMHMKGTSGGQQIDMAQSYSGRKIGGACDSDAQVKQAQEMVGKMCDSSRFTANDWIGRAEMFLKGNACPGKKEPLCSAVRKDAARDAGVYQMLINTEMHNNALITTACGLDLEGTRVAVCRANKSGDYGFLKANCPAEAKAYKEMARKKNCEGRSYTARSAAGCQDGGDGDDEAAEAIAEETSKARARPATGKTDQADAKGKETNKLLDAIPATGNAGADAVVEGAKKLKGLFGF